jgi:guanylate kinase
MRTNDRGVLFIVSSPSGGGKTTIVRRVMPLLAERGIAAHFSVSHTTRPIRPSETDGVDYHFVDKASFDAMVEGGEFLEWAEYEGFQYGTARAELEARLGAGEDVFLDIEVQGAAQVKDQVPEAVRVFVYPPSYEELADRLQKRRQDAPETIQRRLEWAVGEFSAAQGFEYAIINDRLEWAVNALLGICIAEHQRSNRMKTRLEDIRRAFQTTLEKDSK